MSEALSPVVRATDHVLAVRWRDLDPLGHVNNAVFLTYLEEGRNHWLVTVLGDSYGVDEYVVARLEIDFRQEVPAATSRIVASCRAEAIGRTSLTTVEELRTEDGALVASARTVVVLWDPEKRAVRPITLAERARIESSMVAT